MSGITDVIAAHSWTACWTAGPDDGTDMVGIRCECGHLTEGPRGPGHPHYRHVADELTAAGTGDLQEAKRAALLEAADAMDAREGVGDSTDAWTSDLGFYGEAAWLRARAHSLDPEGRALVQAIHDRKTGAPHTVAVDMVDVRTGQIEAHCKDCDAVVATVTEQRVEALGPENALHYWLNVRTEGLNQHRAQLEADNA